MKLADMMRNKIRVQGKSRKTFETYWHWCEKYVRWLRKPSGEWVHPRDAGRVEIERWLTHLATRERVAKTTQNVALQSVLYLYKQVLGIQIENVSAMRARRPETIRDVISVEEVAALFEQLDGVNLLAAQLMYATGLRIGDLVALRIQDVSFERRQITVHSSKGDKSRRVSFPDVIHEAVARQIQSCRVLHAWDCEGNNPNGVSLPGAFRRKSPRAAASFAWFYLFPSDNLSRGEEEVLCRHHRDGDAVTKQIRYAAARAGIDKRVTSHVLRHCFATHSHEMGVPMRTLQQLLGHSDIRTTEIYVHADVNGATAAPSPLERLLASPRPQVEPPRPEPVTLRVVRAEARRTG